MLTTTPHTAHDREAQRTGATQGEESRHPLPLLITIRGQYGSGFMDIARGVSHVLRAPLVDTDDLWRQSARLLQVPIEYLRELERVPFKIWARLRYELERAIEGLGSAGGFMPEIGAHAYVPLPSPPVGRPALTKALREAMGELTTQQRNLVLTGKGTPVLLQDHPQAFHVLVIAPLPWRLRRVMRQYDLDENEAMRRIEAEDGSNRAFIKRYFARDLQDVSLYDLVLSTGKVSIEDAVRSIIDLAGRSYGGPTTVPHRYSDSTL